jgi:hypothetical protein
MKRPTKTKIKRRGTGFEISFSEKDGKSLADLIRNKINDIDKQVENPNPKEG